MTLVFVALSLAALLGIMALAIDLGMLYVARSEAQRAADAAALAGANSFLNTGCTSLAAGCVAGGPQEGPAAIQAIAVAAQNSVAGQTGSVNCPKFTNPNGVSTSCPGITFSYPTKEEPQITVTVQRQAIPTIFAKVFGNFTSSVSATATAEAYNPAGGSTPTQVSCVAPFLVPNCDPNNTGNANSACPYPASYFVDPGSNPPSTATAEPGAVGEQWTLHFGDGPSDAGASSEWYLANVWNPTGNGANNGGAAAVNSSIQQCIPLACGAQVPAVTGKMVGQLDSGVEDRINASGGSTGCPNNCNFNQGQDTIQNVPGGNPPYQIYAGANNPLVQSGTIGAGTPITPTQSPSVVTVAMYSGAICSSTITTDCIGPGGGTLTVDGWATLFLEGYYHGGKYDGVQAMILGVYPCGGSGTTQPPVTTAGGSAIPIRLIQHAN